jgi:hypothetical protein
MLYICVYIGAGAGEHVAAGGGGATSSNARVVLHFEHAYARCMPRHALPGTQLTGFTGTRVQILTQKRYAATSIYVLD